MSAATGEPVGTAAEEAARLLESLGGWFDARTDPAAPDGPPSGSPAQEAQRPHGPTCRACPLCRGVAYLQEAHPDVVTHLTGAAQHLVAALRSLAEPAPDSAGSAPDPAGSAANPDGSAANPDGDRPSRAVRIDVEPEPDPAAAQERANSATEQEQAP